MIEEIIKKNFNVICDTRMQQHVQLWKQWYKGDTGFHKYSVYNGNTSVTCRRESLRMPKRICEDWANLLMNEKVDINTDSESINRRLKEAFNANDFYVRANALTERSFAMGTGAMVEYADANGRAVIDFIPADMIYPISWDGTDISECAFASVKYIHGKEYYYMNIHLLTDAGYEIHNRIYDARDGRETALPKGTQRIVKTGSRYRRFQIIRPNITNNIEDCTPMGISVYANALAEMQGVDMVYDSLINEFKLGKKRIFLPETMVQHKLTETGRKMPIFDKNDTVFYSLPGVEGEVQKPIESNMTLRTSEHITALKECMELLSGKCGLGTERYVYENGGLKTATEVISDKSSLYQNLKKHEIVLKSALISLVKAVADILKLGEVDVKVDFDDSIIEDKEAQFRQKKELAALGVISGAELRSWCLNEAIETSEAAIEKINSGYPAEE